MLLSHRKNGLTSLFKEVRVFKVAVEGLKQREYSIQPVEGATKETWEGLRLSHSEAEAPLQHIPQS